MSGYSSVIEALKIVDPSRAYGTELFNALARITVSVAIEAVCLRCNPETKSIEVYLTQRLPDDSAYPGEWHCPGSVVRPGEEISEVFNRLSKKEFGGKLLNICFVANVNHPGETRGHFLSIVYLCVLEKKEDLKGKWFSLDNLPEKTVKLHRTKVIPVALGAFLAEHTNVCH